MKTALKKLMAPYMGMRREIYIIFISKTINAMGALIFPFMSLLLSQKIGMSKTQAGLYMAILGIMFVPSSLMGGKLSDHFGRKKLLITFEVLGVLSYATCALIEPSMLMVYLLMLAGFFFGVAGPSHDAMTADLTTPEQRPGAYSMNYLGFNLGFAFAQLFAGFLFVHHFKLMFLIDAGTAIIGIALIAIFVKETSSLHQKEDQQVLNEAGEKVLSKDHVQEAKDSADGIVLGTSVLSVLRKRPILIYFAIAAFGYKLVYSQWSFMMPLHATSNFGNDGPPLYGMLGSFNATIVVLLTPLLTAFTKNKRDLQRIIYAGILFMVGFGMLGFVSTKTAFFVSVFIFTLGEILEAISSMPFLMNHTPVSHRARMGSVIPMIMGAGYTFGPIVMGTIQEATSYSVVWKSAGGIMLVAIILMMFLGRYDKRENHEASVMTPNE